RRGLFEPALTEPAFHVLLRRLARLHLRLGSGCVAAARRLKIADLLSQLIRPLASALTGHVPSFSFRPLPTAGLRHALDESRELAAQIVGSGALGLARCPSSGPRGGQDLAPKPFAVRGPLGHPVDGAPETLGPPQLLEDGLLREVEHVRDA